MQATYRCGCKAAGDVVGLTCPMHGDRIVQTTWTDGGRHQPLPPPDDPQGDEIERLTARIAELEAKLERCVRLVVETGTAPNNGTPPDYWVGRDKCYGSAEEAEVAIRAAIETPDSGERREGEA
jgi:hypothetical protein